MWRLRARAAGRVLALWLACALASVPCRAAAQHVSAEPGAPAPAAAPGAAPLAPASPEHLRAMTAPLELRLREVEQQQADYSTLVPWTVLVAGLVTLAAGTALGVGRVLSCEDSCPNDFWPGWLVVGGATVSTAGFVWLRLSQEDQADLESRRYHLQNQLDAIHVEQRGRESAAAGPSLRLRLAF